MVKTITTIIRMIIAVFPKNSDPGVLPVYDLRCLIKSNISPAIM